MKRSIYFIFCFLVFVSYGQNRKLQIVNSIYSITIAPSSNIIWQYRLLGDNRQMDIKAPEFEIDGKVITGRVSAFGLHQGKDLRNGISVYVAEGTLKEDTTIKLSITFHVSDKTPVVRFCYTLTSSESHRFTKMNGRDNLSYLSVSFANTGMAKEIRLSDFNEKYHATTLTEHDVDKRFFEDNQSLMGPILIGKNIGSTFLIAYEHGSQYPDRFLEYQLTKNRDVSLKAVKGNYLNHQPLDQTHDYQTIWFDVAAVTGDEDDLASAYRSFVLKYMTENTESRKPYIFYNTWGRQERIKWAGGTYLSTMNLQTTLSEIEVAHRMGIEVYVLEVGWFLRTGDWEVNTTAYTDSLKQVKALLDKYQMKLGLWFNPLLAAKTSRMLAENRENVVVTNGKADDPFPIWETEESVRLSLVSPYWKKFTEKLINLVHEYGVTYFKWDGIWQHGVDGTGHFYGNEENTPVERDESYAFQLPIYMSRIIDSVSEVCPKTIFDFDITEDGRSVGLQFLTSGKYFIMNNGPYFHSFDLAEPWKSPLANSNANMFVNPGPARGWFTRSVLGYDKWIPSVLFLTHYQADGPYNSQIINLASLVLGQNGIWGELLKLPPENVKTFHDVLDKYKQVRNDITESSPIVTGEPGVSPEIHEKINAGKGVVVIFANAKGEYIYITEHRANPLNWHNEDVSVQYDQVGRAIINSKFKESGAKIIFFGVE